MPDLSQRVLEDPDTDGCHGNNFERPGDGCQFGSYTTSAS